ncbi:hypothetical protein CVT26_004349 [Gymnopilus dilepis]|uniref:F-box domain-containing protein n=1 Tax=Gymnopilus dilepis TaxID=231916 RepID=A0A409W2B8_9AGAR|nr:hypothetical protein CVT26_004349 [Gymnopilus dilepis]
MLPLVLVAKRVREWIEPFLYETLVYSNKFHSYPPIIDGEKWRPSGRLPLFEKATGYAKKVLIEGVTASSAIDIVGNSPNIEVLGIWALPSMFQDCRPLLPLIQSLPTLTRLSTSPRDLFRVRGVPFVFRHEPFDKLTHLEILCMEEGVCNWDTWAELALLPKLTHLAIDYSNITFVTDALMHLPKLKLLVCFYEDRQEVLHRAALRGEEGIRHPRHPNTGIMMDNRVVQIPEVHDWIEDWERGVHGQEDFWKRAEAIQACRSAECRLQ